MSEARQSEPIWRRSVHCTDAACIEISPHDGGVMLRSSLRPARVLHLTTDEWSAFLDGVIGGDFDRSRSEDRRSAAA